MVNVLRFRHNPNVSDLVDREGDEACRWTGRS